MDAPDTARRRVAGLAIWSGPVEPQPLGRGYRLERGIGYGCVRDPATGVDVETVLAGDDALEVATERVPAEVFLRPRYDPT